MSNLERIKMVIADIQMDARNIDGTVLSGKTLGPIFGNMLASMLCIAKAVEDLLEKEAKSVPVVQAGHENFPP